MMNGNTVPSMLDDKAEIRFWKRFTKVLGCLVLLLGFTIAVLLHFACLDLRSHRNLSYLLWKHGHRPYEPAVALGGLYHDKSYRASLIGMEKRDFDRIFTEGFYEVQHLPPAAKAGERWYVNDYRASVNRGELDMKWIAIFAGERLVYFDFGKG